MSRFLSFWPLLIGLTLLALAGCSGKTEKAIDRALIDTSSRSVLYFDLDEPVQGTAAVVVPANSSSPELRAVVAPFSTLPVESRQEVLSSWGSQSGVTLITYLENPSAPATAVLQLKAVYRAGEDADFQRNDLNGTLYHMSSGLKRRFLFQLPVEADVSRLQWSQLNLLAKSSFDSVLVKLPPNAEVFERTPESLAPLSEKDTPSGPLRIYPYPKIGDKTGVRIDIRYQIPPTKLQTQIFDYVVKLFSALLVPIVGLLILSSDKVKAKRLRMVVLIFGVTLEIFILIGMLIWGFYVKNVAGLGAVFEVSLTIIGAVLTVVMARIKGEV